MKLNKIVWGVDVFADLPELEKHAIKNLNNLTKGMDVEIEPICVTADIPVHGHNLFVEKELEKRFKKVKNKKIKDPKIIGEDMVYPPSTQDEIDTLIEYAQKSEADVIAVHSHARSGMSRLLLGSFTETLLLHSPLPVFYLNPKTEVESSFKKILFPTDLSEYGQDVFAHLLELAKTLKAKVFIYHHILDAAPKYLGPYGVLRSDLRTHLEEQEERAWEKVSQFERMANEAGVSHEAIVDVGKRGANESIVRTAKKNECQLIFMQAKSGSMETAVVGSVTRQTIRRAECPVLVWHKKKG